MNFADIEKAINALGEKVNDERQHRRPRIISFWTISSHWEKQSDICCSRAPLNKWVNPLRFVPQARKNELAVEDMDGGTFTISNGGVFGSMFGTPIINPPQSAILGMHGIFDRPVAVNGKVRIVLTDEIQRSSFFKL